MKKEEFYSFADLFLRKVYQEAFQGGLNLDQYEVDHICWRTVSLSSYNEMKGFLDSMGQFLTETLVNGRPIACFKLFQPIFFAKQKISIIECPAPKEGVNYSEGFEHIELIFTGDFKDIVSRYSELKFDTSRLSQKFNPELVVKLPNTGLKFHHYPLERVIELEKRKSIVWDLDGTIIPNFQVRSLLHRSLAIMLQKNINGLEFDKKFRTNFSDLLESFDIPLTKLNLFLEIFAELQKKESVKPYKDVIQVIQLLNQNLHVEQIIWTARDKHTAKWCLEQLGIMNNFTKLVHCASHFSKPSSKSIWLATDGQDPSRTIVIGDSKNDQLSAKEYGATFIGACWDPLHQLSEGVDKLCELMPKIQSVLS